MQAVVGAGPNSSSPQGSDDEPPVLPAVSFDDALTLTVREGQPVQLSARELADMTPAELAKYYKAYVNELAGILVESDNPASQATQVGRRAGRQSVFCWVLGVAAAGGQQQQQQPSHPACSSIPHMH